MAPKPELRIADLPPLTEEEREVAAFRVRDRIWAAIGDLFDRYREEEGLSFADLGRRIDRPRSQIQRWLRAPVNMTFASAGLLAEGLDADVVVRVERRSMPAVGVNSGHPSDDAAAFVSLLEPEELMPSFMFGVSPNDTSSLDATETLISEQMSYEPS
jgi:transcriptional regulator with XRE-family HTH domain